MRYRTTGSFPLSWTQFSEMILDKNMPHHLIDRLRYQLTRFELGSIIVAEYEAHYHEFTKDVSFILDMSIRDFIAL